MKKIFFIAAIITVVSCQLSVVRGQQYARYFERPFAHLGVTVGGGLGSMMYENENGKTMPGLNLDLGVHYTHFLSSIGLGLGVHLTSVGSSATYNHEEVSRNLTHANNPGAHYDLTTRYADWREKEKIMVLGIPVELFYRAQVGHGSQFIGGLGVEVDIPVRGRYSSGGGSYTTTGLFPVGGPHPVSEMPEHGFSTYEETFGAQITDLKLGFSVVADAGLRLALGYSGGVYIGIYGGMGLSSILGEGERKETMLTINAEDASQIYYYGTFAANGNPALRLLRIGVKVGIDLGAPMDN